MYFKYNILNIFDTKQRIMDFPDMYFLIKMNCGMTVLSIVIISQNLRNSEVDSHVKLLSILLIKTGMNGGEYGLLVSC